MGLSAKCICKQPVEYLVVFRGNALGGGGERVKGGGSCGGGGLPPYCLLLSASACYGNDQTRGTLILISAIFLSFVFPFWVVFWCSRECLENTVKRSIKELIS